MAFSSFSEMLSMGGHGLYVWMAYVVSIALLKYLFMAPFYTQARLTRNINAQSAREMRNSDKNAER